MSSKVFIFGSGSTGRSVLQEVEKDHEVIGFLDNDQKRWGEKVGRYEIFSPDIIHNIEFDGIVIASLPGLYEISEQLLDMGVVHKKIIKDYIELTVISRIVFLEKLAELWAGSEVSGSVTEAGVFRGEFARQINRIFPEKRLYLFDTFTGFDRGDVEFEHENGYSQYGESHMDQTSVYQVLENMPYPGVCVIKKGYFPETTLGIDEKFCFVNLDFDLYNPTLAGLEYFYPRMVDGGVILVHDYFSHGYKGIKQAVSEYDKSNGPLSIFPIGDGVSVGIHSGYTS